MTTMRTKKMRERKISKFVNTATQNKTSLKKEANRARKKKSRKKDEKKIEKKTKYYENKHSRLSTR